MKFPCSLNSDLKVLDPSRPPTSGEKPKIATLRNPWTDHNMIGPCEEMQVNRCGNIFVIPSIDQLSGPEKVVGGGG